MEFSYLELTYNYRGRHRICTNNIRDYLDQLVTS